MPTVEALHQLYQWHDLLLRQALRNPLTGEKRARLASLSLGDGSPMALARAAGDLFAVLGAAAASHEIASAIASASDRLYLARIHESAVMNHIPREYESIILVATNGSVATIRHAVWEYHRRRLRRVARIASSISLAS